MAPEGGAGLPAEAGLSILYLRCTGYVEPCPARRQVVAFNSLFEMHEIQKERLAEIKLPFNSLFEMRTP